MALSITDVAERRQQVVAATQQEAEERGLSSTDTFGLLWVRTSDFAATLIEELVPGAEVVKYSSNDAGEPFDRVSFPNGVSFEVSSLFLEETLQHLVENDGHPPIKTEQGIVYYRHREEMARRKLEQEYGVLIDPQVRVDKSSSRYIPDSVFDRYTFPAVSGLGTCFVRFPQAADILAKTEEHGRLPDSLDQYGWARWNKQ